MDLLAKSIRIKMEKGFTLVELMISLGILLVILAITTINVSPLAPNTQLATDLDTLIADIRSQQTMAMSNDSAYGIHFENNSYTLFNGASYVPGTASNFTVNLDNSITFSNVTFPGSTIIFLPGSGDIKSYTAGSDGFTLISTTTNKSTVIKINKYGATY